MGTHEEGTSFENKLAHFVEGLSGLDYTDAIWFLTEVKRAAEERTQLSRANAELLHSSEHAKSALEEMLALGVTYLNETGGCDHSVNICVCDIKGTIENTRAALAKLTTTEAKK